VGKEIVLDVFETSFFHCTVCWFGSGSERRQSGVGIRSKNEYACKIGWISGADNTRKVVILYFASAKY
jgi:hypothetical protein